MAVSWCARSGCWYRADKSQFRRAKPLSFKLNDVHVGARGPGQSIRNGFAPKLAVVGPLWALNSREQPLVLTLLIQQQDVPLLDGEREHDPTFFIRCQLHGGTIPPQGRSRKRESPIPGRTSNRGLRYAQAKFRDQQPRTRLMRPSTERRPYLSFCYAAGHNHFSPLHHDHHFHRGIRRRVVGYTKAKRLFRETEEFCAGWIGDGDDEVVAVDGSTQGRWLP
jgi:hypothetical protein